MTLLALAPLAPLLVALLAFARPGRRPGALPRLAEAAALTALLLALGGAALFVAGGPREGGIGGGPLRLAVRLDLLSAILGVLVAFVGWTVVRYARSQLDGEAREGAFHGLLLVTLAGVLLLVQAGSLLVLVLAFWAVGEGLRRLLLFYPERAAAQRAAAKFALASRLGDAALLMAALLLWLAFGTASVGGILEAARAAPALPWPALAASGFLALAALLKTAAVPVHGWLTEVMEAPTPVSALLHAGIINAGGVLLLRFADVMTASPAALAALFLLGGFSAVFGALVMLTQGAVKTALAWSTVSQMGFMLMQCGLGLWALALLHIVAHSLYKAHAFLSAGGAVAAVTAARRPGPVAVPSPRAVARAFGLAILLYAAVAGAFLALVGLKPPQALALGAILVFGVAYLVAQGLADAAPVALTRRTLSASLAATLAYFAFHALASHLAQEALPAPPVPGPLEWALILFALASFGAVAVAQALFPLWAHHPATAGWRIHLANGLYLNAALDRLTGGFRVPRRRPRRIP